MTSRKSTAKRNFRRFITVLRRLKPREYNYSEDWSCFFHAHGDVLEDLIREGGGFPVRGDWYNSYPPEQRADIRRIARIAMEQLNYLERKEKGDADIEEFEQGRQGREQQISEFLRQHRYVKPVYTIKEELEKLELDDAELRRRHRRIKPIVRFMCSDDGEPLQDENGYFTHHPEGILYYIQRVRSLRNVSFIWYAKPKTKAEGLEELTDIQTYHTCGYVGFFKPSIAEVLAQIPKRHLDRTVAYETGRYDEDITATGSGNYHIAKTTLYTLREQK